jgi:glucan phosphoethanolaminetransferase (alkaline phosphatase superfamily)
MAVGRGDIDAAFDGSMLPDVQSALARPARLKLLVVHTKGSHWDYHLRYPAAFAHFVPDRTPAGDSGKYDRRNRDLLVNAYDNSILYTDHFLAEIIGMLERSGRPAALVYVSDHGQGLYDGDCDMFGQGNDLEMTFRTAGLVWVSRPWRQAHPNADDVIRINSARPLATAGTVFNTVADLGGLNIADRSLSLLDSAMSSQTRWVNSKAGSVDFDRSSRGGACRLVGGTSHP